MGGVLRLGAAGGPLFLGRPVGRWGRSLGPSVGWRPALGRLAGWPGAACRLRARAAARRVGAQSSGGPSLRFLFKTPTGWRENDGQAARSGIPRGRRRPLARDPAADRLSDAPLLHFSTEIAHERQHPDAGATHQGEHGRAAAHRAGWPGHRLAIHFLVLPWPEFPMFQSAAAAVILFLSGSLVAWAQRTYQEAGVPFRPFDTVLPLLTAGPYRFSRNPVYIGMAGLLGGMAVLFGSYVFWPPWWCSSSACTTVTSCSPGTLGRRPRRGLAPVHSTRAPVALMPQREPS